MPDPLNELRDQLADAMLDGTGFLRGNRFDALVLADLCLPAVGVALAGAWDEGYVACPCGGDLEQHEGPPNPYRERS